MYLINSMKSYSIENIRIQDILLISICILLFLNRAVPIDYSSIWRVTVLCLIYTCIRIISKQYRNCLLHMVYIWGITEVIISILQKANYIESNHHDFGITGTFGNPGPLGGLLAVCWIVSIFFIYENIQNKHRILRIQNYKYCKQLPELFLIVNYISSLEIFGNRKKIFPKLKHVIKRLLP